MGEPTSEEAWWLLGRAKKEAIFELIPNEWRIPVPSAAEQRDVTGKYLWQYLTEREIEITETDAEGIVGKVGSGIWTAEEVARAFAHRAALAHQLVNCLHEIFFDAGIEDAKKLDAYYAQHGKVVGPLHGIPVSLKDQFHVKGVETCMGYVGWIGTFQGKKGTGLERVFESEMVRELRNLGAVLYCKTSVPHTLMAGETVNNIIGYTWSPKNRNLSSGGSSGGEGALIAMKGSCLGFGTDIGGSIRIPAAFNGQYGIRPSSGRLPYEGIANSMDGQSTVLSVVGPLSSSISGLRLAFTSLLQQQPWLYDPLVVELPWRTEHEDEVKKFANSSGSDKLVFGVLKHDGVVTPHPPVQRAVDLAVKAIETAGHEVIEWKPPSHERGGNIVAKSWAFDGGEDAHATLELSGEPMAVQVVPVFGTKRSKQFNGSEVATVNVEKREYQREYLQYWNSTSGLTGNGRPVDAFIMPGAPFAAARPARYRYYGYSMVINNTDYPAAIVPVTQVDKTIDVIDKSFTALSDLDKAIAEDYDPEIYDGAPVALQVVGRRLQEEKTLALADVVDKALKALNESKVTHQALSVVRMVNSLHSAATHDSETISSCD